MTASSYPFLSTLRLCAFRSYATLRLEDMPCSPIALIGPNGAGKTNILEAVSLLTPGRGLRAADFSTLTYWGSAQPFAVWGQMEPGGFSLGTTLGTSKNKNIHRILRAQEGAGTLPCLWLTPAMDRLLSGPPAPRRQFLDRLILALNPNHSTLVSRYARVMAERMHLLRTHEGSRIGSPKERAAWLTALELQMAGFGVAIAAGRREMADRLCALALAAQNDDDFPLPLVHWEDDTLPPGALALDAEEAFVKALEGSRALDAATGRSFHGPHRGDLIVTQKDTPMTAQQQSTGEQKALLLGILLAHARLVAKERGAPPILLLDEVTAHLDANRRAILFARLVTLGGQVWLTGTEASLFASLWGNALVLSVPGNGAPLEKFP